MHRLISSLDYFLYYLDTLVPLTVSNESPGLSPASSAGELGITELRIQGPCPESVNPNPNLNKIGNFSMDKKLHFFG